MYALVDCNSFFCSVEKAFHPGLAGKPVCVLSSNDGIIVALTTEAKAVGLHRGDAIFKVREIIDREGVEVFSTNMTLYSAMSRRVTSILRQSVAGVENYSIDESFCDLRGYERFYNLEDYMRDVAGRIRLWTDIPVSIGIAPSKTLAKMGSKFAKQYAGYRGVCLIDSEKKRRRALELFPLDDVWGIGRRTLAKLEALGIHTPLEFADRPGEWVERHFTKPTVQTWKELNGYPCIDTTEILKRQTICTSRSFGEMVTELPDLQAAVSSFAASCANKLRDQESLAGSVTVFLLSNLFREDLPQYSGSASLSFQVPTSDTLEITAAALEILREIWRPGIRYKKAGVVLGHITPSLDYQGDLFDSIGNRPERLRLGTTLDSINQRYGVKTVGLAIEGEKQQPWKVKCLHRSGDYLTSLEGLLTISA